MHPTIKKIIFWTPRILGIVMAIFISLFALDVFGAGNNFWETIVSLMMHLIPTMVLLIVLAVAWRWEWIGGLLFIGLGVLYITLFWDPSRLPGYLLISGLLFLVGILFLLCGCYREEVHPRADS